MYTANTVGLNKWVDDIQTIWGYATHILPLSDLQKEGNDYSYQRWVKQKRPPKK